MGVQETDTIIDPREIATQCDSNGQLSRESAQSLSNGALGVSVIENFGRRLQRIASEESFAKRRSSPRLINIPESKRPYYGSPSQESLHQPGDRISIEKRKKIKSEESSAQTRSSPRLMNIPESKRPCYGTPPKESGDSIGNEKGEQIKCEEPFGQRRCSPRLMNIPESKRPCYGTPPKESPYQPGDSITNKQSGQRTPEKSYAQRRCSPRLINIPESKRHCYGTPQKESGDSVGIEKHEKIKSEEETFVQRRSSPRLTNIPESKRPYYGTTPKESLDSRHQEGDNTGKEKSEQISSPVSSPDAGGEKAGEGEWESDLDHSKQNDLPNGSRKKDADKGSKSGSVVVNGDASSTDCEGGNNGNTDNMECGKSAPNADGKSAYARVKETLRIYNKYYLHFVQEEENRCKKADANVEKVAKDLKRKKAGAADEDVKRSSKRPDLKALSKMLETNAILYPKKGFGHLPGIDVGYQFYSRAEMVALGFHSHWLSGIDYMGKSCSKLKEYKGHTFPVAVAIVLSGQYEDDQDNLDDVVYTGQGGNDLLGKKHQIKNQEMCRGNLALKNNMDQSIPVRVVRGHEIDRSFGKIYTYDGLYKVVDCWPDKGVSGFVVYKYRLRRLEGQPNLTTNQVHFTRGRALNVPSRVPRLACEDICGGQEDLCIPAVNSVDDNSVAPTGFTYSKFIQVAENVTLPPNSHGCKCKGNCTNPKTCACARLNGSDFPYVRRNGGRLIEAKDVVFECGPNCGCEPGCINRISQRGIKYQLEVFRTLDKGWAVRTKDFIPSGAPVCEYTGVLRRTDELDNVAGNDYIFEIDCWQTMKEIEGRERRLGDVSASVSNHLEKADDKTSESTPEFCIDAGFTGNVARFINHSCEPNLFVQCVLSTHHDIRLARIVLFAADGIAPLQELTYDYGYALDSVIDSDGNIREQPCHCGTADCRKRLY